jgi:hypothetical protein
LQVGTIARFQNYKFTLLEGIKTGDTILSFAESADQSLFDVDGIGITILLSPKTGLNVGDRVAIHCDSGFKGSVSSSTLVGVYNTLALECRSEFGLAISKRVLMKTII